MRCANESRRQAAFTRKRQSAYYNIRSVPTNAKTPKIVDATKQLTVPQRDVLPRLSFTHNNNNVGIVAEKIGIVIHFLGNDTNRTNRRGRTSRRSTTLKEKIEPSVRRHVRTDNLYWQALQQQPDAVILSKPPAPPNTIYHEQHE